MFVVVDLRKFVDRDRLDANISLDKLIVFVTLSGPHH